MRFYNSRVIDTDQKLAAFVQELSTATWVAVDTEADSLHAYPEKVCLIQISTAAGDALVDPLAGMKLEPLLDALGGHELILHGSDYDLRLLEKHHQFIPASIFDTMLAARLAGERQFGYSALVEKFLGVKLEKGPQKANWSLRPLTERMEKYARNDTHFLKALADKLRAGLEARGRLAWHAESCARLIADCTKPQPVDGEFVWRVKGSHRLGRPALAVLREIWHWREREALAANRPPFFVMSHEALVGIADAAARGQAVTPLVPRHLSERRRGGLAHAIAKGLDVPPAQQPQLPRRTSRRLTDAQHQRALEIQKIRDAHAHELDIDPTLIASRAMILDLARDWETHASGLMKWQRQFLQP